MTGLVACVVALKVFGLSTGVSSAASAHAESPSGDAAAAEAFGVGLDIEASGVEGIASLGVAGVSVGSEGIVPSLSPPAGFELLADGGLQEDVGFVRLAPAVPDAQTARLSAGARDALEQAELHPRDKRERDRLEVPLPGPPVKPGLLPSGLESYGESLLSSIEDVAEGMDALGNAAVDVAEETLLNQEHEKPGAPPTPKPTWERPQRQKRVGVQEILMAHVSPAEKIAAGRAWVKHNGYLVYGTGAGLVLLLALFLRCVLQSARPVKVDDVSLPNNGLLDPPGVRLKERDSNPSRRMDMFLQEAGIRTQRSSPASSSSRAPAFS